MSICGLGNCIITRVGIRRYNYAHDCVSLCVGVRARVSALSVPGFIIRMPGLALVDGNGEEGGGGGSS